MHASAQQAECSGLAEYEAERLLQAWGHHARREIEDEVGLPGVCPSCEEYEAPDWTPPPPPLCSPADLDRACWVMVVMAPRHKRLHRDARDHYRDGAKLGFQRIREIRLVFARVWGEWAHLEGPTNAI